MSCEIDFWFIIYICFYGYVFWPTSSTKIRLPTCAIAIRINVASLFLEKEKIALMTKVLYDALIRLRAYHMNVCLIYALRCISRQTLRHPPFIGWFFLCISKITNIKNVRLKFNFRNAQKT